MRRVRCAGVVVIGGRVARCDRFLAEVESSDVCVLGSLALRLRCPRCRALNRITFEGDGFSQQVEPAARHCAAV